MLVKSLTPKQKKILDFITKFYEENDYAPSLEEIARHFKRSIPTIYQYIETLKAKRFLRKQDKVSRGIKPRQTEVEIPLFGYIAAGEPIEAISNPEPIKVPKTMLGKTGLHYALKVKGDSMINEGIHDGDTVIIRRQETAENGQKVVALIDGYEVTLKKLYRENGRIRLQPANPNIKPIYIDPSRLIIQGIVMDIIQNVKKETYKEPSIREPKSKKTVYQKLPLNQIICGDAVTVMKSMPECSIDLTVTSPPYDELRNYNGYRFNFEAIAKNLFRVTKNGGVVIWVVGDKIKNGDRSLTSFKQALFFQLIGFNVHDVMIYKKKNTPFMRSNAYTNCFEFMFVFSKGSPKVFNPLRVKTVRKGLEMVPFNKGADAVNKKTLKELKTEKTMTNIWEYAVGLGGSTNDKIAFKHPAIFPEKLAEDHILSWTNPGDIVFDPMCGSGTTCKMALKNKRFYIGCDISAEYVELTKKRLEAWKSQLNLL